MKHTPERAAANVCCPKFHEHKHVGGPWYQCANCGGYWKDYGPGVVYVGREKP